MQKARNQNGNGTLEAKKPNKLGTVASWQQSRQL